MGDVMLTNITKYKIFGNDLSDFPRHMKNFTYTISS